VAHLACFEGKGRRGKPNCADESVGMPLIEGKGRGGKGVFDAGIELKMLGQ
jgi:hypothetical protein